jgi:hypothetical protein
MINILRTLVTTTLAAGTLAIAAPAFAAVPLGSEQTPPRYVDETDLLMTLYGGSDGYTIHSYARVIGVTSPSDAVQMEISQKGKILATKRCAFNQVDGDQGELKCDYDEKRLKATGPVQVDLVYLNDQNDEKYLLRRFDLTIAAYHWNKEPHYQIVGDDLIGSAFLWHKVTGDDYGRGESELRFYFWTARSIGLIKGQLRCTVDGKKQPDFEANLGSNVDISAEELIKDTRNTYVWARGEMEVSGLYWGTRAEVTKARRSEPGTNDRLLVDLPGAWACDLRSDGKVIRQFNFTVTKEGKVAPHPAQSAKGAPMLMPGVVMLDMRLPKDDSFDERVNPAAIKAGHRWGLKWPDDPTVKEMLNNLPKKSGLPDPGKGK